MTPNILILPASKKRDGFGHIKRCIDLAEDLGTGAYLALPEEMRDFAETLNFPGHRIISNALTDRPWDFVIFDKRKTPAEEVREFLKRGIPVIAVDEGGPARSECTFCIDILPKPGNREFPNCGDISFLKLPETRSTGIRVVKNILVTFGGEDPADLTSSFCGSLEKWDLLSKYNVTAVIGPLFQGIDLPEQVNRLGNIKNLPGIFPQYDCVVTSFGLTGFEAAAFGLPVMHLNPGRYHRKLSRFAGFPEIGIRKPRKRTFLRFISDAETLRSQCLRIIPEKRERLSEKIHSLFLKRPPSCPVCGGFYVKSAARFPGKSYFSCSQCGALFCYPFTPPVVYNNEYFFSEYKAQYGKTYLEDFSHIKNLSEGRLKIIKACLSHNGDSEPSLLDAGCAFGPFLQAAKEVGFSGFGIDVSVIAVEYVRKTLHIPADCSDFAGFIPENVFSRASFSVLTMWYVIEHFSSPGLILEKVNALLPPGGIFAFSTPNGRGASWRKSHRKFLESSPNDHFTVWNPRWARKILKKYGFTCRKIRSTGHHPERIWSAGLKKRKIILGLLMAVSRLLRLGDTFEVYAEKTGSPDPHWKRHSTS